MSKPVKKFSPEVRARAVKLVLERENRELHQANEILRKASGSGSNGTESSIEHKLQQDGYPVRRLIHGLMRFLSPFDRRNQPTFRTSIKGRFSAIADVSKPPHPTDKEICRSGCCSQQGQPTSYQRFACRNGNDQRPRGSVSDH